MVVKEGGRGEKNSWHSRQKGGVADRQHEALLETDPGPQTFNEEPLASWRPDTNNVILSACLFLLILNLLV